MLRIVRCMITMLGVHTSNHAARRRTRNCRLEKQMLDVKAKVGVIGEFFIDEIFTEFSALPKLGEEAFAGKFRREVGGGAAITACCLAKLGVRVKVLGSVGKADGEWVVDRLKSQGVD